MYDLGIYAKYTIYHNDTGQVLPDEVFVLRPERDPLARTALLAYADAVQDSNPRLAKELREWMRSLEDGR